MNQQICVFGLVGKGFALVVADTSVIHNILVHKSNEDKVMILHSHKLMGASDEASDRILTRKVQAANNGIPLSIYQEACCALTSGASRAYIWHPFLASSPSLKNEAPRLMDPPNCRKLFSALSSKQEMTGLYHCGKVRGIS